MLIQVMKSHVMRALKEQCSIMKGMEHILWRYIWYQQKKLSKCGTVQKRKSERKFYPGYVLVEMEMNDDTWHLGKIDAAGHGVYRWNAGQTCTD